MPVSAIRHIPAAAALLLLSLSLPAQPQAPARPTGIDALLHSARTSGDEFLPVDQAFRFTALADGSDRVRLDWEIADGYYLYRARIKVTTPSSSVRLGATQFPQGQVKKDDYFGKQEVYHRELSASVPVIRSTGGAIELPLQVTYQGCADAGLCYPPVTRSVTVKLAGAAAAATPGAPITAAGAGGSAAADGFGDQGWFVGQIRNDSLALMVFWFYVAGLALAFTPCVLPMVPILSGIIAGGGKSLPGTGRAFALSLSYVLGMALTYTAAGVAGAAMGKEVQALFQQWWVLGLFAAVFVALALSMFGLFTLQMPVAIQTRIAGISNRQSAGTFGGVAVMGALSALIVTTCVAPALVAAVLFISQTGQIARGGVALFAMGIGMGTPLLIVGASAGRLLPKAGPWMELVKKLIGVMMLAVAAWMLARVVPERIALLLWAVPAFTLAWLLWFELRSRSGAAWGLRAVGLAAAVYAVVLATGSALGGTDPLAPIPAFAVRTPALSFRSIKSVADLDRVVAQATARHQGVLVDFSAEWCTSCKEMERYTFTDPAVQAALKGAVLLRADVTHNNADDQALLQHFGIFGPPTIAFYGTDGQERATYRVVGFMKADDFAARARAALRSAS